MEPVRLAEVGLAWTPIGTVPLPEPPPVHAFTHGRAFATAQSQPVPVETSTAYVPPDADADTVVALSEKRHGELDEKVNGFDGSLSAAPSGPMALTRASYSPPGRDQPATWEEKSKRILPSASGDGFPMSTVPTCAETPSG